MGNRMCYFLIALLVILLSGCDAVFSKISAISVPDSREEYHHLLLPSISDVLINSRCDLPCFGNLTPTLSTVSDILTFISNVDRDNIISEQIVQNSRYGFSLFFDDGLFTLDFVTENQVLQQIRIGITQPVEWLSQSMFGMPEILTSLGIPDDIFMLVSGPPLGYSIILVYNSTGVLVRYQIYLNRQEEIIDNQEAIPICWYSEEVNVQQIDVWLQSPTQDVLVELNQPDLRDERDTRPWWSIDEFVNYDKVSFAEFFIENHNGCIPSMSLNELQAVGYQY